MRRVVERSGLGWDAPAPFAPERSLAEALLTPTRLYVRPLLPALRATEGVRALAHITGGGYPDNLPRVLPDDLAVSLDLAAFAPQPVFSWLAATGGIAEAEMLRTFNCGFGMAVFVAQAERGRGGEGAQGRRSRPHPHRPLVPARGRGGGHERQARPVTRRVRTAILISGRGSNMSALIEAARAPGYPAEIALVLSDNARRGGLAFARAEGIDARGHGSQGPRDPRGLRGGVAGASRSRADRACLSRGLHAGPEPGLRRRLGRAHAQHPPLAPAGPQGSEHP